MSQLAHAQPQVVRFRLPLRVWLAAVALIAGAAIAVFFMISAGEEATQTPKTAVSETAADVRYDGGPEEGTRGIVPAPQASVSPATEFKNEAAIATAIGQSSDGTVTRGSKASQFGTSQYRFAQPNPGTQLDEEAEEAHRTDPHGPASALP